MPWQNNIRQLIRKPVGVSLKDGQGVSGILCDARAGKIYLIEYLSKSQFALKNYDYWLIEDINLFPPCGNRR